MGDVIHTGEGAARLEQVVLNMPEARFYFSDEGETAAESLRAGFGGMGQAGGHLQNAVDEMRREGHKVSLCHFNYINPLPHGVREIFARFRRIVVCELNEGQFANYLRQNFQEFHYEQYNKCEGQPFTVVELKEKFESLLK